MKKKKYNPYGNPYRSDDLGGRYPMMMVAVFVIVMALFFSLMSKKPEEAEETKDISNFNVSEVLEYDIVDNVYIMDFIEPGYRLDGFEIPEYVGEPYTVMNSNVPYFAGKDLLSVSFEYYSELDVYGRCGICVANIGTDLMPTEARESIGSVKPTGWHTVKYNDLIEGNYLYNRCHLIGFQLAGENANEKNLITGTRYLNVTGMLPFENLIAEHVKSTEGHVLYRATPIFTGDDLVARGVLLEAVSVEDGGTGVCFNVFCHNVQPGIKIDYRTGDSHIDDAASDQEIAYAWSDSVVDRKDAEYAVNSRNGKIHRIDKCDATRDGSDAKMSSPVFFKNYEDALKYSEHIVPEHDSRDCGICFR